MTLLSRTCEGRLFSSRTWRGEERGGGVFSKNKAAIGRSKSTEKLRRLSEDGHSWERTPFSCRSFIFTYIYLCLFIDTITL